MAKNPANTGDHELGEKYPHTGDYGDGVSKQDQADYEAWLKKQPKSEDKPKHLITVEELLKKRAGKSMKGRDDA